MSYKTEKACDNYDSHLLDKANVIGVGGGDKKLLVFVTEKKPLDQLQKRDVVEEEIEDVETDVIEVGKIEALLKPGSSIGISGAGTGTYGGPVRDELGNQYLLTNNHVAADSNRARALTNILHPGPADGSGKNIGVLARFEPIYFNRPNHIDAALVRANSNTRLDKLPKSSTTTGRVNWIVQKTGRTSGHTYGTIIARNSTVDVDFGSQGVARFRNQLVTDEMLWPGDSGSVLLSKNGHPVGLGFAGSSTISLHNPINLVLRALGVKFV